MLKSIKGKIKIIAAAALLGMALNVSLTAFADEQGTVTVESAKIRASADTSSDQLGSASKGSTVTIVGETTGTDGNTWYEVYVNDSTTGYIRSDLVSKSSSSSAETSTTSSSTVTEMTATTATVSAKSANVRKSASTDSSVVATVSKGVTLTVSGQTTGTDGNTWYKISFKYNDSDVEGYVRSDLVSFEEVSNEAAVSEITGEENVEEQTDEETEATEQETEEADSSSSSSSSDMILMNVDEEPYVMPGFELVTLDWNGQEIKAYMNGSFFIFYAQEQSGEEGWYILDREENVYQRYVYTTDGATVPDSDSGSVNLVVVIVLVVIIIIMAAVIGFLAIRLRRGDDEYEYYEDDDEDDDDVEDLEELDDEFERPVRRQRASQGGTAGNQPVRRPQQSAQQGSRAQQSAQGQPVRRPQQSTQQRSASQGQPVRRPQQSAQQGSRPQQSVQGQPVRRPQQSAQQGAPTQRGTAQQQGAASSRQGAAATQGSRTVQKGQRAKNLLETDDDMDFIDI